MPGIDESLTFYPLRIAVLTVSDTRDRGDRHVRRPAGRAARPAPATSSPAARSSPDEVEAIRGQVQAWVADPAVDLIITTGGTGFAPRDVTPEAVKPLLTGARWTASRSSSTRPASARSASRRSSRAPSPARSATPSSSACPARPAPAATAGTWCSALELDSRYRPCSLAGQMPRLRDRAHEQAQPCRQGRPRAHGRRVGQGADATASRPRPRLRCAAARDARPGPRRHGAQGRGDRDRRAGRHDGRQAHRRSDPALPSAAADQGRR